MMYAAGSRFLLLLDFTSQELRVIFQSQEHPSKKLKPNNKEDPIDETLLKAMIAYKKTNSNRGPMNSFIAHCPTINQHELIGILQYFLQISPNTSSEQFRYTITVLDFLARITAPKLYPVEFDIIKGHVDQVLLVAWSKQQGKALNRRQFLDVYEKQWPLILPEAAVKTIMAHEGSWVNVESELRAVTNSSALGKELFGVCCYQVLAERVAAVISKHIHKMFDQGPSITKEIYDTAKRATLAELQADTLTGLPDRRKIILNYRDTTFEATITCVGDEVETKFNAALKEHAAGHGLIPELFCEADLVEKPTTKDVQIVGSLLKGAIAARKAANEGLQGELGSDGATIANYLNKKCKHLVAMDPMFKTDSQWMLSMVGVAGERRLEQKCMEMLPSATKSMTLTGSIQKLQALRGSPLCAFCCESAQGAVMSLLDVLGLMVAGKAPNIKANSTDFIKKVLIRLQYFCKYGEDGKQTGAAAATAHLQTLLATTSAKCSIADIEPVVVFSWLLSQEDQAKAAGFVKDVLSNARATSGKDLQPHLPARSQASSSSGPAKKKAKSGEKAVKNEVQGALDMFG
jgi:hypothetical protein